MMSPKDERLRVERRKMVEMVILFDDHDESQ